jgi:3-methyl-2-oxobutanoate hydroxymethyltransferase
MEPVAAEITRRLTIPTIGIGASARCDGQVLVIDDAIGLTVDRVPKFVKEYAELRTEVSRAAMSYAAEVKARTFPTAEHVFKPKDKS